MLIVMQTNATAAEIDHVCKIIQELGFLSHPMPGAQRTAICITGNPGDVPPQHFTCMPGVKEVIAVSKAYKLASRETKNETTIVQVGNEKIGEDLTIIAGPCSVEKESTTLRIAEKIHQLGIKFFRAGAFKPRTSPYGFQGLGQEGLKILAKVKDTFGLHIVTEVMDCETLPEVAEVADILQVGTRNMSNTSLLKALGKQKKPVLLKRGMSATLDEFLLAAEYILMNGNYQVILCERGIRTFGNHARNTLDLAAIPVLQERSHLPVMVDPSHAAGLTRLVAPLSRAGIAAGACGIIIEVHDDAAHASSDGEQAVHPDAMKKLLIELRKINEIVRCNK